MAATGVLGPVSVGRAAQMLGISEYLARQMVRRGELPVVRFGRLIRISKQRLITMINEGRD